MQRPNIACGLQHHVGKAARRPAMADGRWGVGAWDRGRGLARPNRPGRGFASARSATIFAPSRPSRPPRFGPLCHRTPDRLSCEQRGQRSAIHGGARRACWRALPREAATRLRGAATTAAKRTVHGRVSGGVSGTSPMEARPNFDLAQVARLHASSRALACMLTGHAATAPVSVDASAVELDAEK